MSDLPEADGLMALIARAVRASASPLGHVEALRDLAEVVRALGTASGAGAELRALIDQLSEAIDAHERSQDRADYARLCERRTALERWLGPAPPAPQAAPGLPVPICG